MADLPEFQRKQRAFAAHIRDPDRYPAPPAIEDRRMAIYRDLFLNNLLTLLGSTFPVLKRLHAPDRWRRLVRAFMSRHRAHTPYFLEIPREFLNFLEKEYEPEESDPPFIQELAHYEWVELALSVAPEENDLQGIDADGDLLDGVPVKSILAWSLAYRFPVHRISRSYRPREPGEQPTFLVVHRTPDDELRFMELNPVTARLLELIGENDRQRTGRELLVALAEEMSYSDRDALLNHGAAAMDDLRRSGILLGVKRRADQ